MRITILFQTQTFHEKILSYTCKSIWSHQKVLHSIYWRTDADVNNINISSTYWYLSASGHHSTHRFSKILTVLWIFKLTSNRGLHLIQFWENVCQILESELPVFLSAVLPSTGVVWWEHMAGSAAVSAHECFMWTSHRRIGC